jgi:hypothetical protein
MLGDPAPYIRPEFEKRVADIRTERSGRWTMTSGTFTNLLRRNSDSSSINAVNVSSARAMKRLSVVAMRVHNEDCLPVRIHA